MPIDGQPVRVAFVGRSEDIAEALWRECFPRPREGLFWYRALESARLEDQFAFEYAVLHAGDRPVGIAPCFRHDVPLALVAPAPVAWALRQLARIWPRAGRQRTFFVGSPCSDEGTIGLVRGVTLAGVAGELWNAARARARRTGASLTVFKDFADADAAVLAGFGPPGDYVSTVSYPGTVVDLPPPDKEAFYRSLTHKRRHNLLKKLRRSRELMDLETRLVCRPTDAELAEAFGLFRQTYARGRTKFERLGLPFFESICQCEAARFLVQRDRRDGAMVAFMLLFCLGDRVINKFIGLDYRRAGPTFLYFRLFDAALDVAYACGARELQSGQTGYQPKLDLGHRLVPLFNVFHHEQALVHGVFRAVGSRVSWRSLDPDLARHAAGDAKRRGTLAGLRRKEAVP